MKHAVKAFENEIIHLDGQTYIDCEFKNCRLVYSGGEVPKFDICQFHACTWQLDGAAGRTAAFLKILSASGNRGLVDGILLGIVGKRINDL
jgi:hypothetical protein